MTDGAIPEDVKQFILLHIDSIAQMEGLLLFFTQPQKEWDAQGLAQSLFIDQAQSAAILTQLASHGFIAPSAAPLHYQYHPITAEWGNMVERIADLYRRYLLPVTNLIHAKPPTRIQQFADAFKIRKE